jgi:branched-chain amino acid transport system ATP-binding protein
MSQLLEVTNLELNYGGATALNGVTLTVDKGEMVALVGANGAGKSSFIRAVAGIERPVTGKIFFAGQQITALESHQICNLGIGQVAEGRQLFPTLTVLENLHMGAMVPRSRGRMKQSLAEVFALFPRLADRQMQVAGTLSGGEQQMLAIGRCLMGSPELIMLDEPSLGLAPNLVEEMLQAIQSLNRNGLTLLLVEQNVAASLQICQRGYVLESGCVVMSGTGTELLNDDRVRQAYLGL